MGSNSQARMIAAIQASALQAVNFSQGVAEALKRARRNFTPEGWAGYIKWMQGFLDDKGAPTFSSSFVPSGNAVITSHDESEVHLKVPGTLVQTSGKSRTTYSHSEIDVIAGGAPMKITHFECVLAVRIH